MAAPTGHVGPGGGGEEEEEETEEEEDEEGEEEEGLRAVFPRDPELFAESFPARRRFRLCGRVLRIAELHGPGLGTAGNVWEAALSLCRFLGEQRLDLGGRRVLELGAGTGIVGIFAAMLGAGGGAEVTLTDRPAALPQLRENVRQNFPGGSPEGVAGGGPAGAGAALGAGPAPLPPQIPPGAGLRHRLLRRDPERDIEIYGLTPREGEQLTGGWGGPEGD
ncbi:EEF1A lysine methyltransferase 3-like [Pseudopipra pipra]|uniref:EEF1A lysine methyltransferase 3-like n=1 Tax=Pseudopipra pipra TaxID=415032 RepID=UPI003139A21F